MMGDIFSRLRYWNSWLPSRRSRNCESRFELSMLLCTADSIISAKKTIGICEGCISPGLICVAPSRWMALGLGGFGSIVLIGFLGGILAKTVVSV